MRLIPSGTNYGWRLSVGRVNTKNPLLDQIRNLGLMGHRSYDKFIPNEYLYSDRADRLALLQGLFDTDGSVANTTGVDYITTSLELAKGVKELVQSLGGTVSANLRHPIYTHNGEKEWKTCLSPLHKITIGHSTVPPVKKGKRLSSSREI